MAEDLENMTPDEAQAEISRTMADAIVNPQSVYFNRKMPGHKEAIERVSRLFQIKNAKSKKSKE